MSDLTKQPCFLSQTRVTESVCLPLRLTTIVAGLLLTMMPFLTGCGGGGGETGSAPSAEPARATASLAWSPVPDPSITAYFVHYGRHSPGQPGSCTYESSKHVAPPTDMATAASAKVTDLEPNTVYYFTVSAYNGVESACSEEVSTVTPPASV